MSTFIDGIGSCQVIDKSSEIVDLKGLDITSLAKTGTFTWEHQAGTPATLVGKILEAKKIFSKDDCKNDRELYFWNKCKAPYLYVMGELLDDYTASAKECAGQMRYSRDNPDQKPLLGFSIEGSEIPNSRGSSKMIVARGIARKTTLTQSPCNSACIAEIYENLNQKSQVKDDFEELFRSEQEAITLFKSGEGEKIYETFLAKREEAPAAVKDPYNEYENKGIRIGTTKSGKHVFSHGHIGDYDFNPAEHKEAGEFHQHAVVTADNPKLADNHIERMKAHNNAAISGGRQENRAALSLNQKRKISEEVSKNPMEKNEKKACKLHKAQVPGSKYPPKEKNPLGTPQITSAPPTFGPMPTQAPKLGKSEGSNWSSGKVSGESVHYNHPEHGTVSIQKQPSGEFHVKHQGKLAGVGGVKGSFAGPKEAGAHAKKYMQAVSQKKIFAPKMQNISSESLLGKSDLKKAVEAGSYNAAPSTLVNGAAYQTESLSSKQSNAGEHNFQATKKKDWNKRAKDDYQNWPHRERFEKFMKARMPHLAEGEIKAIGRVLSLKKSVEFEKSLESLVLLNKSKK